MTRGPSRSYTRADVLEIMESHRDDPHEPWTSLEIADELGCSRDIAYDRLKELRELRKVKTKEVGSRARVWWIPGQTVESAATA